MKKLLMLAVGVLLASSASADVVKYEMKDVLLSNGTKLGGWIYQSTINNSIIYYDLGVFGLLSMSWGSDIYANVQSPHNYFGGNGPTSFVTQTSTLRDDDYIGTLNLQFLPGTGIDILVKGSITRVPTQSWIGPPSTYAIQYGTVTKKVITDPDEIARVSMYLGGQLGTTPTVSLANPIQVPEPGSVSLLLFGAIAIGAVSKHRKGRINKT